ncbi:splicing factor, proline- and glutamine-rich-like [Uranotaenia lowii]|uniref:splicing factor, proline- and glutamine-rich-like n=1 Tax=Uranotaenia lowii TaxID=190385 RepID=UPI00247869BD|nr:splicing factor, proline- and glutamine-rich-like [Uranotaenia lowii]
MSISQQRYHHPHHSTSSMYPSGGPNRYYREPDPGYPEDYMQQHPQQQYHPHQYGPPPSQGSYGEVPPYESGYEPPPGSSAGPGYGYHPPQGPHGPPHPQHISAQYSMAAMRRGGHPDMINRGGGPGYLMPWYGGPPRAYPIPPEHMYNMYNFNR